MLVLHPGTATREAPACGLSRGGGVTFSPHWKRSEQKPLDKLRASPGGVGYPGSAAPRLFLGAAGRFRGSPWAPSWIWAGSGYLPSEGAVRRGSCCQRADGESFCLAFPRGDAIIQCCSPSTEGFATARPAAGARPFAAPLPHDARSQAAPGVAELPVAAVNHVLCGCESLALASNRLNVVVGAHPCGAAAASPPP